MQQQRPLSPLLFLVLCYGVYAVQCQSVNGGFGSVLWRTPCEHCYGPMAIRCTSCRPRHPWRSSAGRTTNIAHIDTTSQPSLPYPSIITPLTCSSSTSLTCSTFPSPCPPLSPSPPPFRMSLCLTSMTAPDTIPATQWPSTLTVRSSTRASQMSASLACGWWTPPACSPLRSWPWANSRTSNPRTELGSSGRHPLRAVAAGIGGGARRLRVGLHLPLLQHHARNYTTAPVGLPQAVAVGGAGQLYFGDYYNMNYHSCSFSPASPSSSSSSTIVTEGLGVEGDGTSGCGRECSERRLRTRRSGDGERVQGQGPWWDARATPLPRGHGGTSSPPAPHHPLILRGVCQHRTRKEGMMLLLIQSSPTATPRPYRQPATVATDASGVAVRLVKKVARRISVAHLCPQLMRARATRHLCVR